MRGWLMWLWRLTSPAVCHLQTTGPRELLVVFQAKSKGLRPSHPQSIMPRQGVIYQGITTPTASTWEADVVPR